MRPSTVQAQQIVANLTTEQKIQLLSGHDFWTTEDLSDHGVPSITMTDGPHGLRKQPDDTDNPGIGTSVPATCFPPAVTLASTWDVDLVEQVGAAVGAEARDQGVSVVLGPGLNIKRHPAGGRNFEYYSEDPFISGKMAAAAVRGIQSNGVGACLKHYAANNQEFNRNVVDTLVDERTLREIYLTGFEIAVKDAKPWTIMSSYNRLNGQHTGESRDLMTDILRHEWGFDGMAMTDWSATYHRPTAIAAGLDLEMPGSTGAWDSAVAAALASGTLTKAAVDSAAVRVVDLMIRARDHDGGPASVTADYDAHHRLARTVAAAGSVLLTNNGALPLSPSGRIGVIGAFAESPRYQGGGSSLVNPTRMDAPLEAIRAAVGDDATVTYAPGYDLATGDTNDDLLADALELAASSDVVVLLAGLPPLLESEGYDRQHLRLPDGHDRLIEAVTEANPATVVVLFNGSPVLMPWVDKPAAILESYLGGQAVGSALADVLFGVAEPGGRLAETFPRRQEDVPADANFPGSGRQVQYREGLHVGYRAGAPTPLFAFGHGLGYTTFEMTDLAVSEVEGGYEATVTVTNTGSRTGSTVVQVYTRYPQSVVPRPDLHLVGFAKVHVDAGASSTVTVPITRRSLAVWDVTAHDWMVEAGECEVMAGFASDAIQARQTITVDSPDHISSAMGTQTLVASDDEFAALLGRPIPAPERVVPFHRDSTVEELRATWAGRYVYRVITRTAAAAFTGEAAAEMLSMVKAIIQQMPLRAVAMSSEGKVSLERMDRIIRILNLLSVKAWFAPRRPR